MRRSGLLGACGTAQNSGQFVTCVGSAGTAAKNAGLISQSQVNALTACATGSSGTE